MTPSAYQLDALAELTNIGLGKAIGGLSEELGAEIELEVPRSTIRSPLSPLYCRDHKDEGELFLVEVPFTGSLKGKGCLLFPKEALPRLFAPLPGDNRQAFFQTLASTFIVKALTAITVLINRSLWYHNPHSRHGIRKDLLPWEKKSKKSAYLSSQTVFLVEKRMVWGEFYLLIEQESIRALCMAVEGLGRERKI